MPIFIVLLGVVAERVDAAGRVQPPVVPAARVVFTAGGLTADVVAERAKASGLEVRSRAEEYTIAAAAVDQAIAAFIPRLSGVARYSRLSTVRAPRLGNVVLAPSDAQAGSVPDASKLQVTPLTFSVLTDQYTAQATVQLPLSDYLMRSPQMYAAAASNARAAALAEAATRLRVAVEARTLYYGWVRARLQVGVVEEALEQARGHLSDARHAVAAGSASRADVLRAESQVASAEFLVIRIRNLVVLCEQQLRTIMHDETGRRYEVGEDVSADLNSQVGTGSGNTIGAQTMESLWAEALNRRLEVRALQESAGASREEAKAARAAGLPRLDAVGNIVYAAPNPRVFPQEATYRGTWDVTVQLSWAPTDLFASESAGHIARARAAETDARRAALLDAIRLEVTQSALAEAEAGGGVKTAGRSLVAAEESYRVRRVLFQNGRATSIELTDAETEVTRARLEVIGAEIDLHIAGARLIHALGRDIN